MTASAKHSAARKLVSALLLGTVGIASGFFLLGLATFYVYFIGGYLGALIGLGLGAWVGWRTPLRDSIILFVSFYGGYLIGAAVADKIAHGAASDRIVQSLLPIALPGVMAHVAAGLVFLPIRKYLPIAQRSGVAATLSVAAVLYLIWRLYLFAYVWQPS